MRAVLRPWSVSAMAVTMLFAGCSQSTTAPISDGAGAAKESAAAVETVTAKTAFWPMYKSARSWAPDAVILGLRPKEVTGFKNDAGKAAMWEATFASPSLHQYVVDTYAITTVLPDVHKGVSGGLRLPWGGQTRDAMPIDPSAFNTDSDAAYATAAADAAAWLKKNPDKKLSALQLGNVYKLHAPVWYVMWGDTKSGYIVYVDAASGKVLQNK
jgi:hypothetical protein